MLYSVHTPTISAAQTLIEIKIASIDYISINTSAVFVASSSLVNSSTPFTLIDGSLMPFFILTGWFKYSKSNTP